MTNIKFSATFTVGRYSDMFATYMYSFWLRILIKHGILDMFPHLYHRFLAQISHWRCTPHREKIMQNFTARKNFSLKQWMNNYKKNPETFDIFKDYAYCPIGAVCTTFRKRIFILDNFRSFLFIADSSQIKWHQMFLRFWSPRKALKKHKMHISYLNKMSQNIFNI